MAKHALLLAVLLLLSPAIAFAQARDGQIQAMSPPVGQAMAPTPAPQIDAPVLIAQRGGMGGGHMGGMGGGHVGGMSGHVGGAPGGAHFGGAPHTVIAPRGLGSTGFHDGHFVHDGRFIHDGHTVFVAPITPFPSWGFGYDPWFWNWWGYPYGYYGDYYGYYTGKIKVEHAPKDAQVFLDGGYAGTVGDLKKFRLAPGAYNLEVREGDRELVNQKIYVVGGKTVRAYATATTGLANR